MPQSFPTSKSTRARRRLRGVLLGAVALAVTATGLAVAPAQAAVGDTPIAWLEVENGVITGGPGFNAGDHGNFSGTGSYTFRDPGMRSSMSFTAPEAGTYPVWIRYSAGGLGNAADDNVVRKMGLLVNGGSRQRLDFPATFVAGEADQHDGWERWSWARANVALNAGANTLAVDCQRNVEAGGDETCRLNFDAIQVGGTAPTGGTPAAPCTPSTAIPTGANRLFDGTLASLDGTIAAPRWHKAGAGGFGFQADCTLRGFRGQGTTWALAQQSGPYTLGVDFMRGASTSASSVYFASTSNGSPAPSGGYGVKIGATDTGTIVSGDGTVNLPADPTALADALRPQGQWNSFAIQLTPARVRVLLNGTKVNSVDRTAAMTGYVGLENRAGDDAVSNVKFRNIYVDSTVVLGRMSAPARRARLTNGTSANPGGESTLGNLVAEAQRWATRGAASGSATIALASPTALAADLVAAGSYPSSTTYAQAAAAVTSEPLVNMRLTGAQLKTVLEQQWQRTSDGSVPATPFRRLGASAGFTWTHDSTRTEGDRITGMWLNGAAIAPSGTYAVTVSQSLAAGGDNFRGLVGGIGMRDTGATSVSALAAYVADNAPITPERTQHAVGVHVPGGAPSSYVAGTTFAVDLSSWSYSTAADPQDSAVAVSVDGQPIGTFPVDNTLADDPYDDHGQVAVRATLPLDLGAGSRLVTITGATTGTEVRLPITVTAAPAPTPTPTPTPTPDPTPTPTPTPSTPPSTTPVVAKARATVSAKVKQRRVVVRRTRVKLVVRVRSSGVTPTGKVTVQVGKKKVRATLRRGKVRFVLPAFKARRAARVKVTYTGDARTLSAARTIRIKVLRA